MASLAEQLAELANPTPHFEDPEEDINEETRAQLVAKSEGDDTEEVASSKLRRKTIKLLADEDSKYAGKKVSRKSLMDDFVDSGEDDDEEDDEEDEDSEVGDQEEEESDSVGDDKKDNGDEETEDDEEGAEDEDIETEDDEDIEKFKEQLKLKAGTDKEFRFQDDGDYGKYDDDDEVEDEDSDDEEDEGNDAEEDEEEAGDDDDGDDDDEEEEEEEDMSKFSKSNVSEEIEKGNAAKNQLALWDGLLEGRIKLQKAVFQANQLPQFATWQEFSKKGGEEFKDAAKEGQTALKSLLDALTRLQTILLIRNPETKHVVEGGAKQSAKKTGGDDDDEEITSESDEASGNESEKETKVSEVAMKRKISNDEYPSFLAKRHKSFQTYRNNTIQKWYDKTRLASGKMTSKSFSAFDQSALKQIEHVLSDQDRLIKRTQLKRSAYRVLGQEEKKEEVEGDAPLDDENEEAIPRRDHLKDYDLEVFDDDDYYHQLLRELIERKRADLNDPVELSRQWLDIQKLRKKMKKKLDTKASKGRMIRFNVLSKMVNFMAPIDNCQWSDEARDDLYSSLFGKRHTGATAEPTDR